MATLKAKEIRKMNEEEIKRKLKELKLELTKAKANPTKKGSRSREIKKIIARILTIKGKNGNLS